MHVTIPKLSSTIIPIVDTSSTCGEYGVIIQALDANGAYISPDLTQLQQTSGASAAVAGILLQLLASPTNLPSFMVFAPFVGKLYAVNPAANDALFEVLIFKIAPTS